MHDGMRMLIGYFPKILFFKLLATLFLVARYFLAGDLFVVFVWFFYVVVDTESCENRPIVVWIGSIKL